MSDEKKIIVDDDWKKQAQTEKEKLASEIKKEKEQETKRSLPKGDISGLINMLTTQAMFALGLIAPPGEEDKIKVDLALAKYNIDLLEALEEKTKGNLLGGEANLLNDSLNQLRMIFVQVSSASKDASNKEKTEQ